MLASTADASSGIVPDDFPTIQRALDQAMPGDVIQVKDGTYFEKVRFIRSGNAADGFITLQPFPGHRPILDGTDVPGTHMVLIDSVSYVQLIGFELRNNLGVEDGSGVRILGSGSHIEIRRNRIHDIRGIDAMGITVYGTSTTASISDLVIDQNELYDLEPAQSEALTLNGNIERFVVSRNTVRDVNSIGIDFIGGELDINPDPTKVPRNGVCRFNQVSRAHANYGGGFAAGIYVDGGRNLVVENNIVSGSDIGIEVGAENAGVVASGVIIRNNLVYGNDKPCLVFGGFDASVGRVRNSQFLNNTCHKNDRVATGVGELWIQHAENNIVRGNVFVGRNPELLLSEDGAVDNSLDYNLWFTPTGELVARFTWEGTTYEGYAAYQAGSEQDRRSPFADPLFVHAAGADFHLRPGSPAIDVGDPVIVPAVGELDMDLEARRMGPRVDIGADEFRPPGCVYSLTPLGRAFHRQGGLGTVTVEAPVGCSWTALSLDDWITVAEVTGDNSGSVTYSVSPSNAGPSSRTGTLLIGTQQFTVTQLGSSSIPIVTITEPTNGPTWTTILTLLTLSGTALDDAALVSVTWANDRGGAGVAAGTQAWVAANIPIQEGLNVITVTAEDASGYRTVDVITVTQSVADPAPSSVPVPCS